MPTPPTPAQAAAPFDLGNSLLAEQPSLLVTALVQTPAGQRLATTIRTPSATVTVFLSAKEAKAWAANLEGAAAGMSESGLIAAVPGLPAVNGTPT